MMSNRLIKFSFPVILLFGVYFIGPSPEKPLFSPTIPEVPSDADALEQYIKDIDSKHEIKPGNEAEIVWNDSTRQKTEYAIVYLHGFSASKIEGDPVHRRFANAFGCNLFLPRLADHGVDTTETLLLFTADRLWESAKEALAIGKQLGDKVILVCTSTGSTVGIKLAADYPQDVHAIINMSPNIAINDGSAFLLNKPWGLHMARIVLGGKYRHTGHTDDHARFWNRKYRLEAVVQLQELLDQTMTKETFAKVTQPSLTMYYYKNEKEQDPQVKVSAMLIMHEQLGTAPDLKVKKAFPDANAHVIGCSLTSGDLEGVYATITDFARVQLKMKN